MKDFKENNSNKTATARVSTRNEKMVISLFFYRKSGEVRMECNFPIFHEQMDFIDALGGLPFGTLMEMQRKNDDASESLLTFQLHPMAVMKDGVAGFNYYNNFLKLLEALPDLMEAYFGEE